MPNHVTVGTQHNTLSHFLFGSLERPSHGLAGVDFLSPVSVVKLVDTRLEDTLTIKALPTKCAYPVLFLHSVQSVYFVLSGLPVIRVPLLLVFTCAVSASAYDTLTTGLVRMKGREGFLCVALPAHFH